MYLGARIYYKKGPIKPQDMDFVSGLAEIEADRSVPFVSEIHVPPLIDDCSYDEPPPRNMVERIWAWLVSIFISSFELHNLSLEHRCKPEPEVT